jgi:hypothetical protein
MKKQKHATSSPAELGKLLRILGTKKQRERTPLAWYRTERGLAVRLTPGGGVVIIAGEPGTVEAAARGEITTSRASFAGRTDAITGAGADVVHAYQAADAYEAGEARPEEQHGAPIESYRLPVEMIEALGWCADAAATDEARLLLQSVAVQLIPGGLRLVAGANYRIHLAGTSEGYEKAEPVQELHLPRRVAAYLASRGEPVRVDFHYHRATMEAPGFFASWSDTGAKWPDFRSVIPAKDDQTGAVRVSPESLAGAVESVADRAAVELAIAGKSRESVQLVALATGARSFEIGAGAARASVAAAGEGAGAATIDRRYLAEALAGMNKRNTCAVHFAGEVRPVVFRDVAGRVAVVMPVRVPAEGSELVRDLESKARMQDAIEKATGTAPAAEIEPAHA